ncbi:MAG: hypothetical protein AVDCRST_MAG40-1595, partial [uncultured Gemmatimonadaceae bacterium]
ERERRRARVQPAAEQRVEPRHARADHALANLAHLRVPLTAVGRLDARVEREPVVGEGVGVPAAQVAAAAKLAHLGHAHRLGRDGLVAQRQHPVHHRVRQVRATLDGAGQEDGRAADGLHERLQIEHEAAQGRLLPGARGGRDHAVEDEQRRPARPQGVAQHLEERGQAALLQGSRAAEVDDGVPDGRVVEEGERPEVGEHAAVGLGEQGDVGRPPAARDVGEGELVTEDRLAGAGLALDQVEPAAQQPAAQDGVEPGHAGGDAVESRSRLGRGLAHGCSSLAARLHHGS